MRKLTAVEFLKPVVADYQALGLPIKRLITENGTAYRSQLFARTCQALGIKHTRSPGHTDHRSTARPSVLSRLAWGSEPMAEFGPTVKSERLGCLHL